MDRVALDNVDAEFALVGSLLAWPKTMVMIGDSISAEWFTDDSARVFFEAAKAVHDDGGEVSREAVVGRLPIVAVGREICAHCRRIRYRQPVRGFQQLGHMRRHSRAWRQDPERVPARTHGVPERY